MTLYCRVNNIFYLYVYVYMCKYNKNSIKTRRGETKVVNFYCEVVILYFIYLGAFVRGL